MAGTGWLHGWRLTFRPGEDIGWEGALATLVEDPGAKVFVVLYDMTKEDERNLDRWEGSELGFHQKIRCRVERLSSDTTTDPVSGVGSTCSMRGEGGITVRPGISA